MEDLLNMYEVMDVIAPNQVVLDKKTLDEEVNLEYK